MAAEDHAPAAPDSISNGGASRALPNRDPEAPATGVAAGQKKKLKVASGHADPGGVALFEFSSLSKAVVPGEALADGRAWAHTESLLRPLRRRAESTARPDRVRIRTRKPCVRLRRRLLG